MSDSWQAEYLVRAIPEPPSSSIDRPKGDEVTSDGDRDPAEPVHPLMMDRNEDLEAVRIADQRVVAAQRDLLADGLEVPTATNLFAIVEDFLGSRRGAVGWLASVPETQTSTYSAMTNQVIDSICGDVLWSVLDDRPELALAWRQRTDALAAYRSRLQAGPETDLALTALVRMHCVHAGLVDVAASTTALRLAHLAAMARP